VVTRSVLVAVDGSSAAKAACQAAAAMARCFGAEVTVLHVAVPQPRSSLETSLQAALQAESVARLLGEQILDDARALFGRLPAFRTELRFGDPAEVICARAEELGVDLIVLGRRGLGSVESLLLGSVSAAVARRARCSVLLVRGAVRTAPTGERRKEPELLD
jgi:nucleotide-binding universal stress UspA family protein